MKNRTETESPARLADNLRKLITEAEKVLAENATEYTDDKLSDLQARLEHARDRVTEIYADARKRVSAGAHEADRTIRSHPYESLAVALGVGVLLGAALRRNS